MKNNQKYTISQAGKILKLHPKTLRRWEKSGKFICQRTIGGQRRYSQKDIQILNQIKKGQIPTSTQPTTQLISTKKAAQKLGVTKATVRRWVRENKLTPIKQQGVKKYSLNQIKKLAKLQQPVFQTSAPLTPLITSPPPPIKPPDLPLWLTNPKHQKILKFSILTILAFSLISTIYLLADNNQIKTPSSQPLDLTQDIEVTLPNTASFLNGQVTIGSNAGYLSYLDQTGSLYLKNEALIEQGVTARYFNLIPTSQPEAQIGRQYLDEKTGQIKLYNGTDWISLTSPNLASSSAQILGAQAASFLNSDLDYTFGDQTATASAESFRITLAGPQSQFKILGGASQEILNINDDSIYPITFSQPTLIKANLTAKKLSDEDNLNYFIDPSADLSLNLAGDATISATLRFSKNQDFLTNIFDGLLTSSGGFSVNNQDEYYFNSQGEIKSAFTTTKELDVDNLKLNETTLKLTNNDSLYLFNQNNQGLTITNSGYAGLGTTQPDELLTLKNGNLKITNGDLIVDNQTLNVPDFVFEPDYQLLSPVDLKEFIQTYHHLPGIPSQTQIQSQGINLVSFSLKLLERIEANTLYLLQLFDKLDSLSQRLAVLENSLPLITPYSSQDPVGQFLASNLTAPLSAEQIITQLTSQPATFSGTLTAEKITTKSLEAQNATITGTLTADKVKANTIENLKDQVLAIIDQNQPTELEQEEPDLYYQKIIDSLTSQNLSASPSANLKIAKLDTDTALVSEYLAVMGSAGITDLSVNQTLSINHDMILTQSSISSLKDSLFIQPSGTGTISLMAGLMTLDSKGNVIISGDLTVTGTARLNQVESNLTQTNTLIASEIAAPINEQLKINIASQSAVTIYNPINNQPVAAINASGSASFNSLNLKASGSAVISSGNNHVLVSSSSLTPESQVIITFGSSFAPATKYWVEKNSASQQFTVFVNYPVKEPTLVDWLIIN